MKVRTEFKLSLVIFFILCPNLLWAEFVPEETARQVAVNQMNKSIQARALQRRQKESPKSAVTQQAVPKITEEQIAGTFTATKDEIFVYYVFNFSPEGWAIISADDAAYPVIGYSESGFYDPNVSNQPPALTAWMDNVAAEIADVVIRGLAGLPDAVEAWRHLGVAPSDFVSDLGDTATAQSVAPLIQSTWGQGSGYFVCLPSTSSNSYDKYCPWEYTDGTHDCKNYCPTGCTITAMAQIMRYWQWPLVGQGSHGYDPPYVCSEDCEGFDWRYVDFSQRYYDWSEASMPLNTASDAIAVLMSDIGVAVEVNYTPSGSGAWPGDAFQTYFRYNAGPLEYKSNYSDTDWISKIKTDLDAGRPIYYVGKFSEESSGHAFVCDGYDLSGYFHFNWGWDGAYDGYFTLDDLTPGGGGSFSYIQIAIFDIKPDSSLKVYVDDDYSAGGGNDGHTWLFDAFDNIQDAMNVVYPGGTVYVAAGTYNEAIDFKGRAFRLYGTGGPGVTTINGTGHYHVVQCIRGEDANTILEGFTITGGNASGTDSDGYGGGMYNGNSSSPRVTNCIFSGNSANRGGGMYNTNDSSPTVTDCTFSSNDALNGGGMYNYLQSRPTVTGCMFMSNTASSATYGGGGMFNSESDPTVTNCTFTGNSATNNDGGGMYNVNSDPNLTNCVFFENDAADVGGAMLMTNSNPKVTNCTFYGNSAVYAGGMRIYSSSPTVTNCILWSNTASTSGPEIYAPGETFTVIYSDVAGGWSGTGNIDADPCFGNPGNSDYHLKSQAGRWDPNNRTWIKDTVSSPCIDAGDPNSDWIGEYWPHGERINMGAYGGTPEASASLSKAGNGGDLNLDGGSDYRDMILLIEKWLYEAMLLPENLSRDGIINSFDFAILAHYFELSAHHPNPSDGKKYVRINDHLSWTAGRGATSHDVYFGTSNPPPFIQNQPGATFDPGTMDYNTVYYWRIDEVNKWGKTTGLVWSFKTTTPGPG